MRALMWVCALAVAGCSLIVPGPDDFTYGADDAGTTDGGGTDGGGTDAGPPMDGGDDAGDMDGGPTCAVEETLCGGACVDTMASTEHCGACGSGCADREVCRIGACFDPVLDLSAGPTHSCARRATGRVICWGYNEQGQLGDGSVLTRSMPVEVPLPFPSEQVATGGFAFSSGNGFSCSRDRVGTVMCWGEQAGGTPLIQSLSPEGFVALPPATHLDLGNGIGCALLATGRLNCWGTLAFDATVDGPTEINAPGLSGAWVSTIDVGASHLCATSSDGRVFCMGSNRLGQLGQAPASLSESATFVQVAGITDAEQVTVNGVATCVLRTGGQVSCWGAESVLGIGSIDTVAHPTPIDVPGVGDAVSILGSAGIGAATCALRPDDSLTCWGYDFEEPIAGDTLAPDPYPLAGASNVASYGVGTNHMCVVHRDGTVSCIGRNFWGTLGDGSTTDSQVMVSVVLP